MILVSLAGNGQADTPDQTYVSCSIITSEHLTTLQLYQRGLALDDALDSLPDISRAGKKRVKYIYELVKQVGILNAYSDINSNYARCATLVYERKGAPALDKLDYGYYYCAGENKRRYEIILNIDRFKTFESLLEQTPVSHHDVAAKYFQLIQRKGLLASFDYTANNLKACLSNLK